MERRQSRDDRSSSRDSRGGGRERESSRSERGSRSAGRGFTYQPRSVEDVQKRASMGSKDFDSYLNSAVKMFKPNDGQNTIRILPPTWTDPPPHHYGLDIWVHFSVGPDQQSYLCLHKMKDEPCPVCEELQRARKDREDEQYIKDLEPTRRVLFYMVDRDHESDGLQAWAAPQSFDQNVTKISVDRKTNEVLPIDDPEAGYDVEFDKTGKGIGTKYLGYAIARRESPLGNMRWLDEAIDAPLPSILEFYSYDHITKAFGGTAGGSTRGDARNSRDLDRDRPDDRGSRSSDDDRRSRNGREREPSPPLTWESVHAMSGGELDDLVAAENLDIDPNKADSDEDLADWICEDLKLTKAAERTTSRRSTAAGDKQADDTRSRLASMREARR